MNPSAALTPLPADRGADRHNDARPTAPSTAGVAAGGNQHVNGQGGNDTSSKRPPAEFAAWAGSCPFRRSARGRRHWSRASSGGDRLSSPDGFAGAGSTGPGSAASRSCPPPCASRDTGRPGRRTGGLRGPAGSGRASVVGCPPSTQLAFRFKARHPHDQVIASDLGCDAVVRVAGKIRLEHARKAGRRRRRQGPGAVTSAISGESASGFRHQAGLSERGPGTVHGALTGYEVVVAGG
jgi:hypothetical protein